MSSGPLATRRLRYSQFRRANGADGRTCAGAASSDHRRNRCGCIFLASTTPAHDGRYYLYRRRLPHSRLRNSFAMSATSTEPLVGVINAGSSSVKFSFHEGERRILTGQVDGIGTRPSASATGPEGEKLQPDLGAKPPTVPSEVLPAIMPWAGERLGSR